MKRSKWTAVWVGCALAVLAGAWLVACDGDSGTSAVGDTAPDGAVLTDSAGGDGAGGSDTAPPADVTGGDTKGPGDDTTGDDTGSTTPGCEYNSQCSPPTTVCQDGACVPGCTPGSCGEYNECVVETGVCLIGCLSDEDCTREGFHCDGRTCQGGCVWSGCAADAECDPRSGRCTQSFCFPELIPEGHMLWFQSADPANPSVRFFRLDVAPYVLEPFQVEVKFAAGSDAAIRIDGVIKGQGEGAVAISNPFMADPGERYQVNVACEPTSLQGVYARMEFATTAAICEHPSAAIVAAGTTSCLTLLPAELDLGLVTLGDPALGTLQLRNTCAEPVTLVYMGSIQTGADWRPVRDYAGTVIPPGGRQDVELFFLPKMPAPRNTRFEIVTDHPDNRVLEVMLKGAGVAPIHN